MNKSQRELIAVRQNFLFLVFIYRYASTSQIFWYGDSERQPVSLVQSRWIASEAVGQRFDVRPGHFSTCMMLISIKLLMV